MTIKLADITPAPWNTRGEITPESVAELAASIKEQGLINPITVWMDEYGNGWYCIAGHRRLAALREIGADEVAVTEFKGDAHEAKMVTVTENLQREDVSPIEEAKLVGACLDDGMSAEDIAAKTGRSTAWVNRRRRLLTLDESFAKVSDKFTASQLEKVASFPQKVQKNVAKSAGITTEMNWSSVKWMLERESRELAKAPFCTGDCGACANRTGAQADLWGACDEGALGACLDTKCYERKLREYTEAKIADAVKGANEVVRIKYVWEAPSDATDERDKAHPCAYVCDRCDGAISVKWAASKAAIEEAKAKERAEREERDAAIRAERERETAITDALDAWKDGGEDRKENPAQGLDEMLTGLLAPIECGEDARQYIFERVMDGITGWQNGEGWAEVLIAFPKVAELAGISADDAAYLTGRYFVDESENENANSKENN